MKVEIITQTTQGGVIILTAIDGAPPVELRLSADMAVRLAANLLQAAFLRSPQLHVEGLASQ